MLNRLLLALAFILTFAGCDGNDNGGGSSSTKYRVRYEVTGTFTTACDLFYITRKPGVSPDEQNEGGESLQDTSTLPWEHTFDITVTQLRPFNTQIGAVCSENQDRDVTATIYIDGAEVDSDTRTGQNVNATAVHQLVHGN